VIKKPVNTITFAPTVPVLLPVRSAYGSYLKTVLVTNDNTPPMPLLDAHLGGLFFRECSSQIGKMELWKKGLLQKMFV